MEARVGGGAEGGSGSAALSGFHTPKKLPKLKINSSISQYVLYKKCRYIAKVSM